MQFICPLTCFGFLTTTVTYKHLFCQQARANIKEVHFLPFNPVDKRTAITYIDSDGNWYRASKGAPEQVFKDLYSNSVCPHMKASRILIFQQYGSALNMPAFELLFCEFPKVHFAERQQPESWCVRCKVHNS